MAACVKDEVKCSLLHMKENPDGFLLQVSSRFPCFLIPTKFVMHSVHFPMQLNEHAFKMSSSAGCYRIHGFVQPSYTCLRD